MQLIWLLFVMLKKGCYLKQLCALSVTVRDVKDHGEILWKSKIILQSETHLIDG